MYYADIKIIDVANGPGVRVSLFVSGCTHHCKGCFNPETWDFKYGKEYTKDIEDEIIEYLSPDYIKGLTLLGGDPLEYTNSIALLPLLDRIKKKLPNKDIWCFTGYTWEDLMNTYTLHKDILSYIDVLVDGEFIEELKNLNLKFKGSSNQRIIMVQESLEKGEIVLWK